VSAPPLVVTAGEPAGIGPDLCIALGRRDDLPPLVVIGDERQLRARARTLGEEFRLEVIDLPFPADVRCGRPDPANAATLLEGLERAVAGCSAGEFAAMVTAPLAKHVICDAGIAFTGHTEYLAKLTGSPMPVMLLVAGELRVALASTHLPLRQVPDFLTPERIETVLEILASDLEAKFGISRPEIIVCGLNPHAGEGGHLGSEDRDVIAPVVTRFRDRGARVRGPVPADTAFTPAAGHHDAILAMYHDQGLPVLKYAGFGHAVNVTLGLPIVRTSVDHGTAFDLAGTGRADPGSLVAAVRLAHSIGSRQE
jgi:4-hydroxythreonine-4-phosphate dehydrogenase